MSGRRFRPRRSASLSTAVDAPGATVPAQTAAAQPMISKQALLDEQLSEAVHELPPPAIGLHVPAPASVATSQVPAQIA